MGNKNSARDTNSKGQHWLAARQAEKEILFPGFWDNHANTRGKKSTSKWTASTLWDDFKFSLCT